MENKLEACDFTSMLFTEITIWLFHTKYQFLRLAEKTVRILGSIKIICSTSGIQKPTFLFLFYCIQE